MGSSGTSFNAKKPDKPRQNEKKVKIPGSIGNAGDADAEKEGGEVS